MSADSSKSQDARSVAVSRRGGVRVRGGRLPPIRMRDVAQITGTKKAIVAPNIPQRRVRIKQEIPDGPEQTVGKEQIKIREDKGYRGRGRGREKIFIQTEGCFLGDGPAARIKKEPVDYEKISIPRRCESGGARSKTEVEIKYEKEKINSLLDSYVENEALAVDSDRKQPVRLPFLKIECKQEIKEEEDVKPIIKQEPNDDMWNSLEGKFFTRIKKEVYTEKKEVNDLINSLNEEKEEGLLILLQLPSSLPFEKASDELSQSKDKTAADESQSEEANKESESKSFVDMPEGLIGKLQILKSGRMLLVMGPIRFELEYGLESESIREVVSVKIQSKEEADLTVLGRVERKMIVCPLLKDIFEEIRIAEDSVDEFEYDAAKQKPCK